MGWVFALHAFKPPVPWPLLVTIGWLSAGDVSPYMVCSGAAARFLSMSKSAVVILPFSLLLGPHSGSFVTCHYCCFITVINVYILCSFRGRKVLENRNINDDERIQQLEKELEETILLGEEADRKYDEVTA